MIAALVAAGLASPLGNGTQAVQAALAGRARAQRRLRDFIGRDFGPQLAILAPGAWPPATTAPARMLALAAAALADLAERLPGRPAVADLAVLLPEISPAEGLDQPALAAVADAAGALAAQALGLGIGSVTVHPLGGAALASALAHHAAGLAEGRALLVLASDSHACRQRLNALNQAGRLFSNAKPWGLVPGEGAAALMFAPPQAGLPLIAGAAVAPEMVGEFDAGDSGYDGLTAAALAAVAALEQPVAQVWSDWNNSRYRAAELSYVLLRLGARMAEGVSTDHAPLIFGDAGAAGPAMALALAAARGAPALITGSAPRANLRGAVALQPAFSGSA